MSLQTVEVVAGHCVKALSDCETPLNLARFGLTSDEIMEQIKTTHLRETCRYVEVLQIYKLINNKPVMKNITNVT